MSHRIRPAGVPGTDSRAAPAQWKLRALEASSAKGPNGALQAGFTRATSSGLRGLRIGALR
eukprot:5473118-Alexandrium_andersonii.AAC.1